MLLVRSVKYTFCVGDTVVGLIIPCRGPRQGDPISPYLFIIAAEGLTSLIKKAESQGLYHGCKISRGAPIVSHLLFADDAFLFFRATTNECRSVKSLLKKYKTASGQAVNFTKSSVLFSANISEDRQRDLCTTLEVQEQVEDCLYLGMPLLLSQGKKKAFEFIRKNFARD